MRKLKNKRNLLIILCMVLFFMAVGFAAFSQRLEIGDSSRVTTNWHIYISDAVVKETSGTASGTASITDGVSVTLSPNFKSRGDSITYNITVTNGGDVNAILETITLGDYDTSTITVSIDGISEGDLLNQGESKTFTVTIKYNENAGTLTQKTGDISLDLKYVQSIISSGNGSGVNTIIVGGNNITLTSSGDGLYTDPVETGRYVYRGADPDNYIWLDLNGNGAKTDNEIYRVVAVEADSTIKVIAQNTIGNMVFDPGYSTAIDGVTSENSKDGTRWSAESTDYCYYNKSTTTYYGCNVWSSKTTTLDSRGNNVTSMPRETGSSTTYTLPEAEAYINTYLNGTFLSGLNSSIQSKIALHLFNIGQLSDVSSQTLETDISQESSYKWKGKIALINASDYVRASTNSLCTGAYAYRHTSSCYNNSDTHNYLFHTTASWIMTPQSYLTSHIVLRVPSDGTIYRANAYSSLGIFPVFYLTSNISLGGKGTSSEPYYITN